MTTDWYDTDLLAFAIWSAAVWMLGVAWAAYRAISWVDRMRQWAGSVSDSTHEGSEDGRGPAGVPGLGASPSNGHGWDQFDSAYLAMDGRGTE